MLEQARIAEPFAHRLNAFESTITSFAKRWRPRLPLVPDRELRMSDKTRETLLGWIEAEETGQGHTLTRLAVYAARVTDNARRVGAPPPAAWHARLAGSGPFPNSNCPRPLGMEPDNPMARVRAQRRRHLVDELMPKLRRLNPLWSDDEILESAEAMAELRLLDEEMG